MNISGWVEAGNVAANRVEWRNRVKINTDTNKD